MKGFTLLELLFTLMILDVVLTFGASSFSSLLESSRANRCKQSFSIFMCMLVLRR
ncbi:prepilin-type N-terminal cleavage/methylation domain-containing protein [Vibrio kyushuensis]|uniref:prepilin-type N-terminal cleavage/methylation domain-containing protein n=1 Tax=Vibrio kyushuensis TaxID=2910249 RepID=UPI003D0D6FCF